MRNSVFIAVLLSVMPAMAAEVYDFNVLPGTTAITGAPGATIGWGYSIHNDSSSLWLVTTDLSAGTFQHATPDLLFDFPDLAPGATVTVPYNPSTAAGLYAIVWDASAPAGFMNSGNFSVSAEWWSGDPLSGGQFRFAASGSTQPYVASVMSSAATPEPGTVVLLSLPLLACFLFGRRRNRVATSLKP